MAEQTAEQNKKLTLTDQMRVRFKKVLDTIGGFLNGLGLMPNTMTILGLIGNTVGAFFWLVGK